MKIKRWIRTGNLGMEPKTTDRLLTEAGELLDRVNSWDIVGECVFEGEDGNFYVGNVEFEIVLANPAYVEQVLIEDAEGAEEE